MAWEIGEKIGTYEIREAIGAGGMAAVYRAYHARLDRDVALKVIHPAYQTDKDFLTRFEREAQIVAKLEHPNIISVYDFADHNGQPYLVMRYVEGDTLKDVMSERAPTLSEVTRIVDTVAAALDYAHAQGVLHRDIKPSNVMMDSNGTPYLTDFGLARIVQSGESSLSAGMMVGTPFYISPEQASGSHELTERSDVYALGIMLYEMVVGQRPFDGGSPYATIHKQIYEAPPLPSELNPEIPTEVEMVILQALEKDPMNRYASAGELAAAFRDAVQRSGLTQLNPERSSVIQQQPKPAPTEPKPKRKNTTAEESVLLLMPEEDSWATLPRDEIARRRIQKRQGELIGLFAHATPYVAVNALILFSSGFEPGAFITPLAWGAGLAAHATHVYFTRTQAVNGLYAGFDNDMRDQYGYDWRDTLPNDTIEEEWLNARSHYQEREGLAAHAVVFVMINLMLWLIWSFTIWEGGGVDFPWPLFVLGGWGAGLLAHMLQVRNGGKLDRNSESVQAELAMMQGTSTATHRQPRSKRKNDENVGVRLNDDGEFTESMVDDLFNQDDNQRRRR